MKQKWQRNRASVSAVDFGGIWVDISNKKFERHYR